MCLHWLSNGTGRVCRLIGRVCGLAMFLDWQDNVE